MIIEDISHEIFSKIYRIIGNYFLKTYKAAWDKINSNDNATFLNKLHELLAKDNIKSIIKKNNPNLIISTESYSINTAQVVLKELNITIPHLVVIADPITVLKLWALGKQATEYLVALPLTKKQLRSHGISNPIYVTGFPLRKDFYKTKPSLPNKTTIFLGGSGEGMGGIDKLLALCATNKYLVQNTHFIVVCGKNKPLYNRIKFMNKIINSLSLDLYGYTKKISELIAKSSVVIGKPGPVILFEAITLNKPFIATSKPLPQEENNYNFIVDNNIGLHSTSPKKTVTIINNILKDPTFLQQFSPNLNSLSNSQSKSNEKLWQHISKYL